MPKKKSAKKPKKADAPARPQPAYVMDPPNDDLHNWTMRLADCRFGKLDDGDVIPARPIHHVADSYGAGYQWVDPRYFEHLCAEDADVQKAVKSALTSAKRSGTPSETTIRKLEDAVTNVFQKKYTVTAFKHFARAKPIIAQFLVAEAAAAATPGLLDPD